MTALERADGLFIEHRGHAWVQLDLVDHRLALTDQRTNYVYADGRYTYSSARARAGYDDVPGSHEAHLQAFLEHLDAGLAHAELLPFDSAGRHYSRGGREVWGVKFHGSLGANWDISLELRDHAPLCVKVHANHVETGRPLRHGTGVVSPVSVCAGVAVWNPPRSARVFRHRKHKHFGYSGRAEKLGIYWSWDGDPVQPRPQPGDSGKRVREMPR